MLRHGPRILVCWGTWSGVSCTVRPRQHHVRRVSRESHPCPGRRPLQPRRRLRRAIRDASSIGLATAGPGPRCWAVSKLPMARSLRPHTRHGARCLTKAHQGLRLLRHHCLRCVMYRIRAPRTQYKRCRLPSLLYSQPRLRPWQWPRPMPWGPPSLRVLPRACPYQPHRPQLWPPLSSRPWRTRRICMDPNPSGKSPFLCTRYTTPIASRRLVKRRRLCQRQRCPT